jgi:hypothetical protein
LVLRVCGGKRAALQPCELLLQRLVLGAAPPDVEPVLVGVGSGRGPDHLEHPLGGVFVVTTRDGSVPLKVAGEGPRVLANVSEIYGLAAFGQKQQAVELLEEEGRWLVNSAQYGLAVVGQLPDQGQDRPGRLAI